MCDLSRVAVPLTTIIGKDQQFEWTLLANEELEELQSCVTKSLLLLHPNFEQSFLVETDASDNATRGILSQRREDGHLHPYA